MENDQRNSSLVTDEQLKLILGELRESKKSGLIKSFIQYYVPLGLSFLSIIITAWLGWWQAKWQASWTDIQIRQATANLTAIEIEPSVTLLEEDKTTAARSFQISVNLKCLNGGTLPINISHRHLAVWFGSPSAIVDDSTTMVALNEPEESGAIVWTDRVLNKDLGSCVASPKIDVSAPMSWIHKSSKSSIMYITAKVEMDDGAVRTISKIVPLK